MPKKSSHNQVIAITGTSGFIGSLVLHGLLIRHPEWHILALDLNPPLMKAKNLSFSRIDLTKAHTDSMTAHLFKKHHVTTLIHTALPSRPMKDLEYQHELQSIGSMYLLHAAQTAGIQKLILTSTTDVYGALPSNPNFIPESYPRQGGKVSPFIRDKIEVENLWDAYQQRNRSSCVTILRFATILGPTIQNFKTHFLDQPLIPTVMGYDPLVQFIHEEDLLEAVLSTTEHSYSGVFNITGKGVLPLSRVLRLRGRPHIPLPSPLVYTLGHLFWNLDMTDAHPSHLNYLKYLCIADSEKAQRKMKFHPRYTSEEALLSFIGAHDPNQLAMITREGKVLS